MWIDLNGTELRETLRKLNLFHAGRETFPLDEPIDGLFPELDDASRNLVRGGLVNVNFRVWSDGKIELVS